jgi:acyl CoA:acetate/3-ketoacid CoA transferase alpha subunit
MTELLSLAKAVSRFVRPGMHLNFASTPSRSNAAVREVARQFRGHDPHFELSATGFHSTLHLLGLLRLGRRYIACFFGDNYPTPRPNPLYRTLLAEGAELEHWSLLSYVSALRAGALGQRYAVTQSLAGSTLGEQLAAAGKFWQQPDPAQPDEALGMVAALVPDLVFLHAVAADTAGNALFFPPHSEGFHGALAARQGVIISVERVLPADRLRGMPHLVPLPPSRVLAVCESPFGAHPQPLHFPNELLQVSSYRDDFEHYELWRQLSLDPELFRNFQTQVLDAEDPELAYQRFVGPARLVELSAPERRERAPQAAVPSLRIAAVPSASELTSSERMVLLAARAIVRRARALELCSLLAGIGQAFAAARLAAVISEGSKWPLEISVETGMSGVDPWTCHPFLLSRQTIVSAARLSSVETVLGALTCGAQNRCLGVIGAAQVDRMGNLNSSFAGGELLVGSGGANDIASSASEVLVLCPADPKRLLPRVEFVTSPGRRVRTIVTERGVLERVRSDTAWQLSDALEPPQEAALALQRCAGFEFETRDELAAAAPASALELRFFGHLRNQHLDASGRTRRAAS